MERRQALVPGLVGVSALLFVATTATTAAWCASMPAMDMPMPGGWTMSMAWMRMPGQTWPGAAAAFLAMWSVMMVAMMLPALLPALLRYAEAVARTDGAPVGRLVAIAGATYFGVWGAAGLAVFPIGTATVAIAMTQPTVSRMVPFAIGAVLLIAGVVQFTAFKARALACCGALPGDGRPMATNARRAMRDGLRLGLQCLRCCGNLMTILLVLGVMDPGVMAAVTVAVGVERLAPVGERMARLVGAAIILAGVVQIGRAVVLA
jgi:predicted metal-binding membrane protein